MAEDPDAEPPTYEQLFPGLSLKDKPVCYCRLGSFLMIVKRVSGPCMRGSAARFSEYHLSAAVLTV